MSLKAFHIVFVSASTLLAMGMSAWGFWNYSAPESGETLHLVCGIGSAVAVVALLVYGRYFLKKLQTVSYL